MALFPSAYFKCKCLFRSEGANGGWEGLTFPRAQPPWGPCAPSLMSRTKNSLPLSRRQTGCFCLRKIPAPIKMGSLAALPPPPCKPKCPPPNEEFCRKWRFSCRKKAFFPGVHKIGAAISGPRIADTNFTDTRIFLTVLPSPGIVP